jgi:predicted RNA binding protein YcfA (HicA-like mRNA interferase family)
MPKIPVLKEKDFLSYLLKYGVIEKRISGSHHVLKYNNNTSVLAIHNEDIKRGVFTGVLNQMEIDIDVFIDFINKN